MIEREGRALMKIGGIFHEHHVGYSDLQPGEIVETCFEGPYQPLKPLRWYDEDLADHDVLDLEEPSQSDPNQRIYDR